MYRIGQFSRFTKVTIKALRFYEEEKLLEPCYVDPVNGYRYYNSDQLPVAHKIIALRQCGFSISEIRKILAGRNIAGIFSRRKQDLEAKACETAQQLHSINHYLLHIGKEERLKYEIAIKELPCVLVFAKRMRVESYDSYFTEIPKLGGEIAAINPDIRCLENPPYCFIMYHDGEYRENDIDVEYCEAVTCRGNGKTPDGVVFKTIDRVPEAACVMHKGPYPLLWNAYQAVYKWIEDNHLVPADCPRESYIDGIWNKANNEEEWLTEVQVPILR